MRAARHPPRWSGNDAGVAWKQPGSRLRIGRGRAYVGRRSPRLSGWAVRPGATEIRDVPENSGKVSC
jgi:hypothetical protein